MKDFVVKEISSGGVANELKAIGFDESYRSFAEAKYKYKNIKIYSLSFVQANILKQTALSVGADCATHRDVITAKAEISDCILGGSVSQLKKISDKLSQQPFGLRQLGEKIAKLVGFERFSKTKIVGILNLTPDSFSDGGEFMDCEKAQAHLLSLINAGADLIDIGAESTRPYSVPVSVDIQISRILPILKFAANQNITIPLSIDTRSSIVARECLNAGASIINDVSGFDFDIKIADVVAEFGAKIVIQHSKGIPENMQDNPVYNNLIDEIYLSLSEKINYAISRGISRENIIIDPGIGFGKTREDNFEIIKRIEEFRGLGCEVMLGLSRKSLLNIQKADNDTKDIYTVALNTLAVEKKVDYLRVHNVHLHRKLLDIMSGYVD